MATLSGTLANARRIVVKIGSALLVDAQTGALKSDWLASLAEDVAWLKGRGADVVLVSSGSIALGRGVLGLTPGTLSLEQAQAAAAVGQIRLARAYEQALAHHGATTAQVLVTLEDSADRRRYLNSRATLETLLSLGAVPIVNENDTVATDEIRFGDNDRLAAQVAVTIGADHLVLLSDVDGLYTGNPRVDASATRFDVIDEITPEIEAMAGDAGTGLSKGGMKTKVMAAKTATGAGCAMTITEGSRFNPLKTLEEGAPSTLFVAGTDPKTSRKKWIASMKPQGDIVVDAGAARALGQGKSLLPAGVSAVYGSFGRGDSVTIHGPDGVHIGSGLSRYTADEARAIAGKRSDQIEAVLGYSGRAALIHRDDMSL
ncbi:glutamate 5-kinase [Aliiroseovarius crassostreae]|uniref:Glutamate 5-kinase n=1 Tax=Aliiroseovarius crassostreae TaxID=154981 RepID=A0A9Q9LYF9_9RHOB|nr:glutamate 5-kinase [Aliiroseovarius crassostreae]UWP90226.1 glutamate 5-kinase [Aliiroseovarius crassostreae]UWP96557.1 glutamate 5-kinase [Aliiroseovarius crassostreae]UWP99672.1 glutamate 5-kinase [Aliiroseovarius crassostreae]UWQ02876.1 glutamate 5-kinase [Aliiroseovarius crassostreae]